MSNARDLLHVAQISTINTTTATARPAFDDLGGHVAGDMQLIYPAMGKWRAFWIPQVGDHATVLRLPNGAEEGFILGTHYTASNMPQNGAEGLITLVSTDGKNTVILDATSGAMILEFKDRVTLKCKELTIRAETVKISANVEIDGNVSVDGDITNTGNIATGGVHTDSIGSHCNC